MIHFLHDLPCRSILVQVNYKPTKGLSVYPENIYMFKVNNRNIKKTEIMLKVNTTVIRTTSITCWLYINVDLVVLLITLKGIYPQGMQDTSPYYGRKYIFKVLELFQNVDTNCMKMSLSLSTWVNRVNSDANWMSELKILK